MGWAHALCTPYQWTKQIASHWGGTRNGTIVHWPNSIADKGQCRNQFHHVIDIAPTILEAAGLPAPVSVNGVQQAPLEGVSMLPMLRDGDAPETHDVQYFEIMGNRGIYHQGWTAVTKHRTPWETGDVKTVAFDDDTWELYDTTTDWTQSHNLAKEQPDKLRVLQRQWVIEATKYNVLPLDDRFAERANPDLAGRPQLIKGNRQRLFGGMGRLTESSIVNIKNKSHAVTAEVVAPASGAEGVIIAQGGFTGGWCLYAKDGKAKYCYNFYGLERYYVEGTAKISPGQHQVRMEFAYDGGGLAKGGLVNLYIDGKPVGSGRIDRTMPMILSGDETSDVGMKRGSPITPDLPARSNAFTGTVQLIVIETNPKEVDHLISHEHVMNILMACQ